MIGIELKGRLSVGGLSICVRVVVLLWGDCIGFSQSLFFRWGYLDKLLKDEFDNARIHYGKLAELMAGGIDLLRKAAGALSPRRFYVCFHGGRGRFRTCDLLNVSQALSPWATHPCFPLRAKNIIHQTGDLVNRFGRYFISRKQAN